MTECSPCGKFFTSTNTFDMHRVGDHWPVCTRRCLEDFEMEALGMTERGGVWGMPVSAAKREALDALSRSRRRVLTPSEGSA